MFDLRRRPKKIFRPERQVNKELKNYYHIDTYRNLSDSSFCLLCVDYQTLELLHSLKEPQHYARWVEDYNGRQVRIKPEDEPFVDRLWAKLQEQLADVVCIDALADTIAARLELVGINDSLKELIAIEKYKLAAMTDGKVRDYYYDPARPEDFAQKVGVSVDDLPKYDFNPTDLDILHPNLSTFDAIGDSIITDPISGVTWSTSRRMVERVPSTQINQGTFTDTSLADMYAEVMYYKAGIADIPHTKILIDNLERIDLVLRHIDAKLSRSGRLDLNLPDVPQIRHPVTGERTELAKILDEALANGGNWLGVNIPPVFAEGAPWPLLAWTKPSVFTVGAPRSDDPLGVNEESFNYQNHSAEILADGLLANWRPDIRLTEGLAPIWEFPALDFDLPGNLGHVNIPAIPLYAGTYEAVIPGSSGRGLAYLLKQEEDDVKIFSANIPGLGAVQLRWDDKNRLSIKVPELPGLPSAGPIPKWIAHQFTQRFLLGFAPGEWTIIWPRGSMRGPVEMAMRAAGIKLEGVGLGQLFKDILQVRVPNPAYDPDDPANTEKKKKDGSTFAELFWIKEKADKSDPTGEAKVGGYSMAELFWTPQVKESGEFGKYLPTKTFAQLFNLEPDDPNLHDGIMTVAQIINSLRLMGSTQTDLSGIIQAVNGIKTAIEALELAGATGDMDGITKVLETINQSIVETSDKIAHAIEQIDIINTNILNTGETASIAVDGSITGGKGTGSSTNPSTGTGTGAQPAPLDQPLPNEQPIPSSDVCRWVEMIIDSIIGVYEWLVRAIEWVTTFFGATAVGKIVSYLLENKWFIGQLTAIGLVDPLPDEVVTLPAGTATLITSLVNLAVRLELAYLRLLIESLKLNKAILLTALCNYKYDATNLKDKINDFIESVVREFDDHKEEIRDLLQMVFENPDVMRKFLYQPAPQNTLQ